MWMLVFALTEIVPSTPSVFHQLRGSQAIAATDCYVLGSCMLLVYLLFAYVGFTFFMLYRSYGLLQCLRCMELSAFLMHCLHQLCYHRCFQIGSRMHFWISMPIINIFII